MSGVLTITSGVHLGVQDGDPISQGWFDAAPTTQFSPITLSSASAPKTGGQTIVGHAGLFHEPISFEFERRTRDVLTSGLAAAAAKGLLNGRSRRTLSGFQDAVVQAGFLCRFQWSERNNATPASPNAFDIWGVFEVITPTVRGLTERMAIRVHPCDLVYLVGTDNVSVTPDAYDLLDGGS